MQQDRQRIIRDLFDEYIEMYAQRDVRLTERFSHSFTGFTGSWGRLIQDRDEWIRITLQDFQQVPGPIRLEVIKTALQDFCDHVVSIAATLHIHLPHDGDLLASKETRLLLIFRLEGAVWMITHCSYSVPYQHADEDEVFPLNSLQQENLALQALVAERTQALQESQRIYQLLTEDAEDVHWRMDRDFIITYISPADERQRGFSSAEVVGHSVLEQLTDESGEQLSKALNSGETGRPPDGQSGFSKFEIQYRCKDDSLGWGEVVVKSELNDLGEIVGYHGITRNVTERKQLEEQVRLLAFHDTLTNLPNRRLLLEHLYQAMSENKRSHRYGGLIYLDLDNFKSLNDTHGHAMGDLLLIEVGSRLKHCVREADTVARLGGDEYVVLIREMDTQLALARDQAIAVAEKIRVRLAEPYLLRSSPTALSIEHRCTASIGVALFRGHDELPDDLMKRADQAMYEAKEEGRNRVKFAQDADHKS